MGQIREFMSGIWHKYIASYEGVATLLVVLVISLKLLINRKLTNLHFKKTIVSMPSEITFLIMGFLLSAMVTATDTNQNVELFALVVISLIVIVIQYALERYLDDKLSGKLKLFVIFCISLMYIMSIILYHAVVFGGKTNG